MPELKLDEQFESLPPELGITEEQLSKAMGVQYGQVEALSRLIEKADPETALGRMIVLMKKVRKLLWVSKSGVSPTAPLSTTGSLYNSIYWNTGTPTNMLASQLVVKIEAGDSRLNVTEKAMTALLELQKELRGVVKDHRDYFKDLFKAPAA